MVELGNFKNTVLTFGNFDGVHLGHQEIINKLKYYSHRYQLPSVLISFNPHPRIILGGKSKFLLTSLKFKLKILKRKQIDHIVIIPFSESFSEILPAEFLKDFIVKKFNPSIIVIGKDNTFGYKRTGNYDFMKNYFKTSDCEIKLQKNLVVKNNGKVSSTNIRELILNNDISNANKLLGYEFKIDCIIIKGKQIGRKLTFPTINLLPNDKHHLIPSRGVYFVSVEIDNRHYLGMCNIGMNPTISETSVESIEAHLFECNDNLYGKGCIISFKQYIRKELKFKSKEHLITQLKKDRDMCMEMSE